MEKEKLIEELESIKEKEKQIRKQLNSIDYQERLDDAREYEGRFFKEIGYSNKNYIRCFFVYSTDEESCEPMSLECNYWADNETSYFELKQICDFYPKKWGEVDRYEEISKEEYMHHYNEVQKRISSAFKLNQKL